MRRRLDGVLLLDKPQGLGSNAALQAVKRLYGAQKAGHAGTLDPLASGLLPILFGEATKFSQLALDADKEYLAGARLGVTTTTADAEGEVLERKPVAVAPDALEAALAGLRGPIDQVPPMYSALKHAGQPLYAIARQGRSVERAARRVQIHELQLLRFEGDRLELRVRCSKGTYVRTLVEDLGRVLGCGAHLAALRRTAAGAFRIADAVSLERLQLATPAERDGMLLPVEWLLAGRGPRGPAGRPVLPGPGGPAGARAGGLLRRLRRAGPAARHRRCGAGRRAEAPAPRRAHAAARASG